MPSLKNNLWHLIRSRAPSNDHCFAKLNDGRTVSYSDLQKATARYANALVGLSVRPGDRVAVQVEKSIEAILLYLGCLRAGAIFLPLNAAYTNAEIEYFLGDAAPRLFICDPNRHVAYQATAGENQGRVILTLDGKGEGSLVDLARTLSDTFDDAPMDPDDLAAILYTFGTTGRSKGAMLSHGNLASNASTLVDVWRFTGDDVLIHALPIFHSHGLFVATNVVLLSGASMIFHDKFDAKQVLAALQYATTMMGVPTFYTRLLREHGLTRQTTAHMRLFISGSAPLLAETHHEWRARTYREFCAELISPS
jgi:malonyl-CoA/methylmalonyl-CoA synthetase